MHNKLVSLLKRKEAFLIFILFVFICLVIIVIGPQRVIKLTGQSSTAQHSSSIIPSRAQTQYFIQPTAVTPVHMKIHPGPTGATAQCGDGTYTFTHSTQDICSGHRGVAIWL